ncbi:leucine zipper domain-containing protein, partial [Rhodococcus erythropolis]
MTHRNAPLTVEGRRRLIERCQSRPIAHVAAEMGISRQCAFKWVNRYRQYGDLGLQDRSSTPIHHPTATAAGIVAEIEAMRRTRKSSSLTDRVRVAHRRHHHCSSNGHENLAGPR